MKTIVSSALVEGPLSKIRWTLADGWTIARRNLLRMIHEPAEVILALMIPVIMVLTFGYVFGNALAPPGNESYREFLMPGIFAQTMLYGIAGTATGVALDIEKGVIDRLRSMPMSRSAFVTGRIIADTLRSLVEMVVLILCGLLVGWQWNDGAASALAAVGLIVLLRISLTCVGVFLGLVVPNPDSAGLAVYPLAFPLTVLSSAFVLPEMMPGWLGSLATWNPLSATVGAARELFGNPVMAEDSWAAQNATLMAVAWPLLLIALSVPLAVRRYRRLSR